ncbi:MAG: NAD(P)-dependent oxidoreductase [Candidatus Anstonellales archaeon]
MSNSHTILVTGASGRIGRVVIKNLIKKKEQVRALVRKKESINSLSINSLGEEVEIVYGDITNKRSLIDAVSNVEKIIHLAGSVDFSNQQKMMKINADGTKNLLEICPNSIKRFIHCSSIAVYGKKLDKEEVDEKRKPNPDSIYAKSKMKAEEYCIEHSKRLPITILRLGVVYGPGFDAGYREVFELLRCGRMRIIGDGNNVIPFVHVEDVANAILLALTSNVPSGSFYNIVGEKKTQAEVLSLASKYLDVKPPQKRIHPLLAKAACLFSPTKSEYIDILSSNRSFSSTKAWQELGWRPRISLEDGIKNISEQYKSRQVKGELNESWEN